MVEGPDVDLVDPCRKNSQKILPERVGGCITCKPSSRIGRSGRCNKPDIDPRPLPKGKESGSGVGVDQIGAHPLQTKIIGCCTVDHKGELIPGNSPYRKVEKILEVVVSILKIVQDEGEGHAEHPKPFPVGALNPFREIRNRLLKMLRVSLREESGEKPLEIPAGCSIKKGLGHMIRWFHIHNDPGYGDPLLLEPLHHPIRFFHEGSPVFLVGPVSLGVREKDPGTGIETGADTFPKELLQSIPIGRICELLRMDRLIDPQGMSLE
jgi:hypothetical protein